MARHTAPNASGIDDAYLVQIKVKIPPNGLGNLISEIHVLIRDSMAPDHCKNLPVRAIHQQPFFDVLSECLILRVPTYIFRLVKVDLADELGQPIDVRLIALFAGKGLLQGGQQQVARRFVTCRWITGKILQVDVQQLTTIDLLRKTDAENLVAHCVNFCGALGCPARDKHQGRTYFDPFPRPCNVADTIPGPYPEVFIFEVLAGIIDRVPSSNLRTSRSAH